MLVTLRTVAGLAGLLWSARVVVALLGIRGRAATVLATIVTGAALLVAGAIVLSLLHALDVAGVLSWTAALSLLAVGGWLALGRPRLWVTLIGEPRTLAGAARREPLVAGLLLVAVLALGVEAFLGFAVAPNEQDALLYHLPRAAYWVQYHTGLQFRAGTLGDPEIGNPPNAELMIAWTMVLAHGDALANLVQWPFAWALALSVYVGARLAGFSRASSAYAGALTAILPEPIMQAATAQNDLVAAGLLAAAAVFLVRGLRSRSYGELAVCAMALGLAVGTKGSVIYAVPGLVMLGLAAAMAARPRPRRLIAAGVMLVAAIGVLGAFNYVQNLENTDELSGGMSAEVAADYVKDGPIRDVGRAAWNLLDLPGLGDPGWLHAAAGAAARPLFGHLQGPYYGAPATLKTDVSEDESAYGPVGWIVLMPLVVGCLLLPRVRWPLRLSAAAALAYLVFIALDLGYGPEEGRLLMPAVAFAAPLLALTRRWRPVAWTTSAAALAALLATIAYDQNKPLLRGDSPSILGQSRLEQQLIDSDFAQKLPAIRRLDQLVPAGARLAFLQQDDTIDYVLFGPRLDRYLIPLGDDEVTFGHLEASRARAIFVWNVGEWRRCGSCAKGVGLRRVSLGAGAALLVAHAPQPPARGR